MNHLKALFLYSMFCALLLVGCGTIPEGPHPEVELQTVTIALDADANDRQATSVDLVLCYDKALAKAIGKLDSASYYARVRQLKIDNPETIQIYHWELTPGQSILSYPIKRKECDLLWAGYFFADYKTKGSHRVRVGSAETATLHLKRYDYCMTETGCFSDQGMGSASEPQAAYQNMVNARTGVGGGKQPTQRPVEPRIKASRLDLQHAAKQAEQDQQTIKKQIRTARKFIK